MNKKFEIQARRSNMKTVLFFIVTICIISSSFVFSDILFYTRTSFNFSFMIGLGLFLLGLARFGRKIISS